MTDLQAIGGAHPPSRSPFFDTDEAAEYLRLEQRTLVNWRSRGGGPAYRKHGGRVVYHVADLERWSSANTHE